MKVRGIGPVALGVRRTENHDRYITAPLAQSHALQRFATGLLGQIEVYDGKIGTIGTLRLDAVRNDDELAFNAMFLKRCSLYGGLCRCRYP